MGDLLLSTIDLSHSLLNHDPSLLPELVEIVLSLEALDLQRLLPLRVHDRNDQLFHYVALVMQRLQHGFQGFETHALPLGLQVTSDQVDQAVQHTLDLQRRVV